MDKLKQRRKEVRALRADFARSMREARDRLSPVELFEDVLDVVDSNRRFLDHVQSGVRRNPLIAVILLMGAAWLIRDGRGSEGVSNRRRKPHKALPATTTNLKGDYDDNQPDGLNEWPNLDQQDGPRP